MKFQDKIRENLWVTPADIPKETLEGNSRKLLEEMTNGTAEEVPWSTQGTIQQKPPEELPERNSSKNPRNYSEGTLSEIPRKSLEEIHSVAISEQYFMRPSCRDPGGNPTKISKRKRRRNSKM